MTSATVALVTVLVLLMLGYRFNRDNNSIQQGGLVQFISRPNGADITIGRAKLANSTPNKITVNPGQYTVTMQKEGYKQWSKLVDVTAGQVLWLNYAQLVPNAIETVPVRALGKASQALASPNSRYIAYSSTTSPTVLRLVDVRSSEYDITNISLKQSSAKSVMTLREWSADSQKLLYTNRVGAKTNWEMVDAKTSGESIDLSTTYDIAIKAAAFDPRSRNRVIIQTTDGDLRMIDTSSQSLSPIMVKNVNQFSLVDSKHVVYRYQASKRVQKVGYITLGQTETRDLPVDGTSVRFVAADTYFGTPYVATASTAALMIYRLNNLPTSSSDASLTATSVAAYPLSATPRGLEWRANGRFAVVQHRATFSTYDNELTSYATTKFSTKQTDALRWLDSYHAYYYSAKDMKVVEFDGGNAYSIELENGLSAVLADNGKYIYSIAKNGDGFALMRSQMILD